MEQNNNIPQIEYFLESPKGRLLESHIRNNFPEFYKLLINNYNPIGTKFSERVYMYYNNITNPPNCPICGNPINFRDFKFGYNQVCSK